MGNIKLFNKDNYISESIATIRPVKDQYFVFKTAAFAQFIIGYKYYKVGFDPLTESLVFQNTNEISSLSKSYTLSSKEYSIYKALVEPLLRKYRIFPEKKDYTLFWVDKEKQIFAIQLQNHTNVSIDLNNLKWHEKNRYTGKWGRKYCRIKINKRLHIPKEILNEYFKGATHLQAGYDEDSKKIALRVTQENHPGALKINMINPNDNYYIFFDGFVKYFELLDWVDKTLEHTFDKNTLFLVRSETQTII